MLTPSYPQSSRRQIVKTATYDVNNSPSLFISVTRLIILAFYKPRQLYATKPLKSDPSYILTNDKICLLTTKQQ